MELYLRETQMLDYSNNSIQELIEKRGWRNPDEYDKSGIESWICHISGSIPVMYFFCKAKNIFYFQRGTIIQDGFTTHVSENLMLI